MSDPTNETATRDRASKETGGDAAVQETGGDAAVRALAGLGVTLVFGIPSVHNLPTYDALGRSGGIRVITVRHEQAAAAAADAYSRVTGKLGACISSTGPGAANVMGGLLEAFVSGSPVLHLTGQVESAYLDRGRGFIHEVPDQPAMLRSLSKDVFRVRSAADIRQTIGRAARLALGHPTGPVSVELPIDFQYAAVPAQGAADSAESERGADRPTQAGSAESERGAQGAVAEPERERVEEAAAAIASAERPIIWVGGGAVRDGAEAEVAALARRLGAGVITTPNGRGVLPESDPLSIGNLPWDPGVRALVAEADVLLAIGTRYQGPNTENWKMQLPERIIQVDIDPSVPGRNYEAAIVLSGRARVAVAAILAALDDSARAARAPNPAWGERVAATARGARERLRATLGPQAGLLDELASVISADTVVVKDSTIPAYTWGNRLLPVQRTRRSIMPNGFAIGLGVPHGLGAAAAVKHAGAAAGEPVVCMVGDGGFMVSGTELATIASEELPLVVALFNDGGYGILRNMQDRQFDRRVGVDLGKPDFVGLARSLGVRAKRAATPAEFGKAMRTGIESGQPMLVEVDLEKIGPMARPYAGTSRPPTAPK